MTPLQFPSSTIGSTDSQNGDCTGQLDGNFAVTPDGAAVYTLPLWVPPGRNGMQPELALSYDSRRGYGLLGVGWTLSGIPVITRCQRRISDGDARVQPIKFDATDFFALGGQRLVCVRGEYGADASEYRTRRDSFARITIRSIDALGPLAFEMCTKDGRILTFEADHPASNRIAVVVTGNDADDVKTERSTVRYSWSLRRIEDRSGNFLEIDYGAVVGPPGSTLRGEFLPTQIRYAGHTSDREGLTPTKSIRFFYGGHPESISSYVSGLEIRHAARLERIEMWGPNPDNAELLRLYELTYRISKATNRSLLYSIRECDGVPSSSQQENQRERHLRAGVCKLPVVFDWEKSYPDFQEPQNLGLWSSDAWTRMLSGRLLVADLNGDGRDDLVCMIPKNSIKFADDTRSYYGFMISDEFGIGTLQISSWLAPSWARPKPIDYDMDGRVELLLYKAAESESTTATTVLCRIETDSSGGDMTIAEIESFEPGNYLPVDMEGNRLASLVLPYDNGKFWRNVGGAFFDGPQPLPIPPIGDPRVIGGHLILDIDGDGAMEILCPRYNERPKNTVFLSPGALQFLSQLPPYALRYAAVAPGKPITDVAMYSDEPRVFADLNGDGLVDAILFDSRSSGPPEVTVLINTGNGFVWAATHPLTKVDLRYAEIRPIHYCGDGNQQLLVRPFTGLQDDAMLILRWNGERLEEMPLKVHSLWTYGDKFKVIEVLDVDGDGLDDFAMLNQLRPKPPHIIGDGDDQDIWRDDDDQGGWGTSDDVPKDPPSLQLYRRYGRMPDMLTSITNALGCRRTIRYEPISKRSVYDTVQPTAYPLYAVRSKRWVAAESTIDDGLGGTNRLLYRYQDGRADLLGEGFLGFRVHEVKDSKTGTTTRYTFDLARTEAGIYPLAGMPTEVVTTWNLDGGVQRERTVRTDYAIRTDFSGQAVFAFAQTIDEIEREITTSGAQIVGEQHTKNDFDAFGNQTLIETTWPDGSRETLRTSYAPRISEWLISLPTVEYRESALPPRVGRCTIAFLHDTEGRETHRITNPGAKFMGKYLALPPQVDGVQTLFVSFDYNAEGNVRRIAASPSSTSGSSERSIKFTYDLAEHAWPTSATNALGHVTHMVFHPGLGVLAAVRDPNGQMTRFNYDRFGRLKGHKPPNHDEVSIDYLASIPLSTGIPGVSISQCEVRTFASGPLIETAFDVLERPILERRRARADGKSVLRRTRYNGIGEVAAISMPHFETSQPRWSTFLYDTAHRPTSLHNAVGSDEKFVYQNQSFTWINPRNAKTVCELDVRGRLVRSIEELETGARATTRYEYGVFGSLRTVTDATGMPLRIEHDRLGRIIRIYDYNSRDQRLRYNAFGELESIVRGTKSIIYQFDGLGRVRQMDAPEGATIFTWDTSPHGLGYLASSVSPDNVRIDYSYDVIGRLHAKQWTVRGERLQLGAGFDTVGRLQVVSYPHAGGTPFRLVYQYGAFGELIGVANAANGTPYWTRNDSDASGRFARDVLGNGMTTEWIESSSHPGLIQQIRDSDSSGNEVQNLTYGFDAQLNVRIRTDEVLKAREIAKYDNFDRIENWRRQSSAGSLETTWTYSEVGNVLTSTRWPALGNSSTSLYGYGAGSAGPNAVSSIGSSSYAYDHRGNQVGSSDRTIDFTSFGLPRTLTSSGSTLTYEYDSERQRVFSASDTGEEMLSVADLYERRSSDHSQRFLIRVNGKAIAQVSRQQGQQDQITYLHTDHQASLQATTDANGALIDHVRYTPHGLPIDPADPGGLPPNADTEMMVGFGGHTTSAAPHLIDMRGRWYDPRAARFLSPDPYRPQPCRAQRQNAYSYALNNPLTWSDPSGFDPNADDILPGLIKQWLSDHGLSTDGTWSDYRSAHDWALQQITAAGAIANDTGFDGGGIADLSMRWQGSMPQNLPTMASSRGAPASIVPEFSNENEPPRARRQYTKEFRQRASRELPGPRILDFQNANMGGHIANLRYLLAHNGIPTKLTITNGVLEVLALAPFEQVRNVLDHLYYRGDFTINFIHHRGGQEFRNWASAGFHMKVVYPSAFGPDNGPTRIGDLHLDLNNPLHPDKVFEHLRDAARTPAPK